jgi:hypothetical protein
MQFAKPASNTIIRPLNHRGPCFIPADNVFWAKCAADTAGLTPVPKDYLIIKLLELLQPFFLRCPEFVSNGRI